MNVRKKGNVGGASLDPRRPDELFDAAWYLAKYPDVASKTSDGWAHFIHHGETEGRAPGPGFEPSFYRRTHLALDDDRPFTHYVTQGRALGLAPRPVALSPTQSAFGMTAALRASLNPIVLLGNDARAAGAPILLLEVAHRLSTRGFSPVFLLKQAGPLYSRFSALGPTLIADEGWNLPAMGTVIPHDVPILANTGWGGFLADELGVAARSVVLVHEMPDYLIEQRLLEPAARAGTVVASMPRIESELARLFSAIPDLPEPPTLMTILPGLRSPKVSQTGQDKVRRLLSAQFGTESTIYLSAGYADRRKGFDLFLEAAREITERDPAAAFIWLGDAGSWARNLAAEAQSHGVRLLMPGFRSDTEDWYAAAHVYLLTSRQDPGPTTVMDAAAVGVPFIALNADIGLRDLTEVVAETGEFVDDIETLSARAVEIARADDPVARSKRAAFLRDYRSLEGYVDDLARVLSEGASNRSPTAGARRKRIRWRLVALRFAAENVTQRLVHAVRGAARVSFRKLMVIAPRVAAGARTSVSRRLVSVAVVQGATPSPPSTAVPTLERPAEVAALAPGDRAWLAHPRLLSSLREKADLHLLRDPASPPWSLISDLESSAARIGRISQYDLTAPPRWVRARRSPPPPHRSRYPDAQQHAALALPSGGPISLSRNIGVFVHAYYMDLITPIAERLALIEHPIDLYVSTGDEQKAEQIRELLPAADVRIFPNLGRDIAPKVFGFAEEHAAHDVVLHLHTKRSPHRSDLGGWLAHILDCLLPSVEGIHAILGILAESERVGMVNPTPYPAVGVPRWGPNRAIAEVVTWGRNWPPLPGDHRLAFPAGSMFWARSSALRPVQDLDIPFEAFSESSAADGTLAHAIERLIGVSCGVAGWDQVFVDPVSPAPAVPSETSRTALT